MSATLGGLIKDYRLQKNISQLEIAFAMGWKEPSRLSRIEQGRVGNPSREFLDKLIAIMKLDEEEKNHLLYTGNYLPTKEEIAHIRQQADALIVHWEFPAYIVDFSWRFIHWNSAAADVYMIDKKMVQSLLDNPVNTLTMVFDPSFIQNRFLKGRELNHWHMFLENKLTLFQHAQRGREKDKWYLTLMKQMMGNDLFRRLWLKIQKNTEAVNVLSYERKSLVNYKDISKRLEMHIFKDPLILDPRFEIDFHIPADIETMKYFNK